MVRGSAFQPLNPGVDSFHASTLAALFLRQLLILCDGVAFKRLCACGELLVAGAGTAGFKVRLLSLDRANQPRKTFARAPEFFVSLGQSILRPCKFGLSCFDFCGKSRALRVIIRDVARQLVFPWNIREFALLHLKLEAPAQLTQMTLESFQPGREFLGSISGSEVHHLLTDLLVARQIFLP